MTWLLAMQILSYLANDEWPRQTRSANGFADTADAVRHQSWRDQQDHQSHLQVFQKDVFALEYVVMLLLLPMCMLFADLFFAHASSVGCSLLNTSRNLQVRFPRQVIPINIASMKCASVLCTMRPPTNMQVLHASARVCILCLRGDRKSVV